MWRRRTLSLGATTTPAQCDSPERRLVVSARISSLVRWRFELATWASIFACSSAASGLRLSRASTNSRNPAWVGTRPALVWGEKISPLSSRSAMTLRMDAGDREPGRVRAMVREPTGSPVAR